MRSLTTVLVLAAAARAAPPENLPSDTCVAVHLDLAALAKTKVYEQIAEPLIAAAAGPCDYKAFCESAGFKIEDVESVTLGLCGDLDDPDVYMLARGKFDAAKVEAFLTGIGEYAVTKRDGMTVFLSKSVGSIPADPEIAIVEGGLLLGTARGSLEKMLAARKPDATESEVSKLLRGAGEAHLSCAVLGTAAVRKSMAEDPEMALFSGVKSIVMTANVRDKVEISYDFKAEGGVESLKGTATLTSETIVAMVLDEMAADGGSGEAGEGCDEPCGCGEGEPFGDD
ncbi:MAG TPA: hypothetical protein VFY93_02825 [Planctomycetota bacterium]|nr:hypothetical protein [Planctomycetota bacterium]